MSKCIWILLFITNITFRNHIQAQSQEAKQLLLDVAKLASLKNILTDLKKGYDIISNGYNSIKNISEGNFNLHQTFLNSLLQISPAVKKYQHVADIVNTEIKLVSEYKTAFRQIKQSEKFSSDEINYIGKVYSNLFNESEKNIGDLATILTANKLRMSDDERLNTIDDLWKIGNEELAFLRNFNTGSKILALQRAKDENDVSTISKLSDVNH